MPHSAVTMEDLLADFEATAARWRELLLAHPEAAEVPTDIAGTGTVGALVWHIYAASYRHAQRLLGEPITDLEAGQGPGEGPHDLPAGFALQQQAADKLRGFLARTTPDELSEVLRFETRTGRNQAAPTRRKLFLHIAVHAIRHWAQIATLLRTAGHPVPGRHDILFSEVIE